MSIQNLGHVDDSSTGRYSIRAVERVCDIFDILRKSGGQHIGLAEVAEASHLPKSSAFRYLATLESRSYVERDPTSGTYTFGMAMIAQQENYLDRLTKAYHPLLELLRDEFEETANLGVLDGSDVVYLDIVESPRSVRLVAHPGTRDEIHCTALGKAMVAEYPVEKIRALTRPPYRAHTPRSITNEADLMKELTRVHGEGFARDDEENELGGRCVAVKLAGVDAAISVSAPAPRMNREQMAITGRRLIESIASFEANMRNGQT